MIFPHWPDLSGCPKIKWVPENVKGSKGSQRDIDYIIHWSMFRGVGLCICGASIIISITPPGVERALHLWKKSSAWFPYGYGLLVIAIQSLRQGRTSLCPLCQTALFWQHSRTGTNSTTDTSGNVSKLFPRKSTWTPNPGASKTLDLNCEKILLDVKQLRLKTLKYSNLTPEERQGLSQHQRRTDIVIKLIDKGEIVIVWRKDLYIAEGNKQLRYPSFYQPRTQDGTVDNNHVVKSTTTTLILQGGISSWNSDVLIHPWQLLGQTYFLYATENTQIGQFQENYSINSYRAHKSY